jgi:hypothetical protein
MCGNEPSGNAVDTLYCRHCGDHTVFEPLSDCCGEDVRKPNSRDLQLQVAALRGKLELIQELRDQEHISPEVYLTCIDKLKEEESILDIETKSVEDDLAARNRLLQLKMEASHVSS